MFGWIGIVVATLSVLCTIGAAVAARRRFRLDESVATIKQANAEMNRATGRLRIVEVEVFLAQHEALLENPDLDFLVSSSLLKRATDLLVELSREINAWQDDDYPLDDLQALMSAYSRLNEFVEKAFEFHEKKFGPPEGAEAQRKEAQSNVIDARHRFGA